MIKKRYVTFEDQQRLVGKICRDIAVSGWRPDYIVGITRGGLQPAVMLSHYFDCPLHTVKVSLRDNTHQELPDWLSEEMLGLYNEGESGPKKILVVDDINDSGATINWILDRLATVQQKMKIELAPLSKVKFAVLFDNLASNARVKMDYVGEEINKDDNPEWIVFPYENWWY